MSRPGARRDGLAPVGARQFEPVSRVGPVGSAAGVGEGSVFSGSVVPGRGERMSCRRGDLDACRRRRRFAPGGVGGVADPVGRTGEADVAGRVDLAGHRCRRGRSVDGVGRLTTPHPARPLARDGMSAGVGRDEHTAVDGAARARRRRRPRRSGRRATRRPCSATVAKLILPFVADPPGRRWPARLQRSDRCSRASSGPGRGPASWNRSNGGTLPIA